MKLVRNLILFTLVIAFTKCQPTVTPPTATPASTGTLKSAATGDCLPVTVAGVYKTDSTLSTGNYIDVTADITTTGTYTIVSDSVNGMKFTATGTFTTTGINQVRLKGNGKPISAGAHVFKISYNNSICSVPVTVIAPPAATAVYTIAGAPNACLSMGVYGSYYPGVAVTADNYVNLSVHITKTGTYTISTPIVNGIGFSATGTFTATGIAVPVKLMASGTPTAVGSNSFTPKGDGASNMCSFTIQTTNKPSSTLFSCKLNGVFYNFSDSLSDYFDTTGTYGGYALQMHGYTRLPPNDLLQNITIFIIPNSNRPMTAGVYTERDTSVPAGYRLSVSIYAYNPDKSMYAWVQNSVLLNNLPMTVNVTSLTPTRIKGTFAGQVTTPYVSPALPGTITEGVFDLPIRPLTIPPH